MHNYECGIVQKPFVIVHPYFVKRRCLIEIIAGNYEFMENVSEKKLKTLQCENLARVYWLFVIYKNLINLQCVFMIKLKVKFRLYKIIIHARIISDVNNRFYAHRKRTTKNMVLCEQLLS